MTALALSAYDGNATANRMQRVRNSYVEALIASSSVPVGAKPVELRIRDFDRPTLEQHRNNLFIDGGARFGVFMQEMRDAQAVARSDAPDSQVTMVVNNALAIAPWRDSEDLQQPKKGWLITTLGLRAVDILESQVYQLSVGLIEAKADHLRMAFISKDGIVGGEEPDAHLYRGKSCGDLHRQDEVTLHPIQFYPTYMACLIDYGRQRGQRNQWNL
jgi:predicted acylesterase/phospholipase RssA